MPIRIPARPLSKEEALIVEKKQKAYALWAHSRITSEQKEYAEKLYRLNVLLMIAFTGCDVLTAFRETPYLIPTKAASKKTFPFPLPPNILDEYQTILAKAKEWKRKKFRSESNRIITAQEIFQGVPQKNILKYPEMTPSRIAYEVLTHKYKLYRSGEAVKKYLGKLKSMLKAAQNFKPSLAALAKDRKEKGNFAPIHWVVEAIRQSMMGKIDKVASESTLMIELRRQARTYTEEKASMREKKALPSAILTQFMSSGNFPQKESNSLS